MIAQDLPSAPRVNFNQELDHSHLWTFIREARVRIDSFREGAISISSFSFGEIGQINPDRTIDMFAAKKLEAHVNPSPT